MLTDLLTSATEALCRGCFIEPAGHIAPECCGINGVQALIILFGVLGLLSRLPFLRFIHLMVVTVIAAIAQNFIRVSILILSESILSTQAWHILHLLIGYVTALLAILILIHVFNKLNKKGITP